MLTWQRLACALLVVLGWAESATASQGVGSIRGVVYDKDFEAPLSGVLIEVIGTSLQVQSGDLGNYVLSAVPPGTYSLRFRKDGYVSQLRHDVVVAEGRLTDVDVYLPGNFVDMEEFVVQDALQLGAGTEAELLQLRFESPALMDSISSELMSASGVSDAASALRLVSGATVQDGKKAVIRGLPDRYVSSQLNGVRLPSADEDKRAVELDQFPNTVIESLQVSKTFTPDQQGDASGGAVNIRLKSIPEETSLSLLGQYGFNSQVRGSDFLSYENGGVNTWGRDGGGRDAQPITDPFSNWDGAAGSEVTSPPQNYKWSISGGGKYDLTDDIKIGGFGSMFYKRDSSHFDNGINDNYWVLTPGGGEMTPQTNPLVSQPNIGDSFTTELFDVTQSAESVQWAGLGLVGLETENHALSLSYLYSHTAEDKTTRSEDTRGKLWMLEQNGFDPADYDPNDIMGIGNGPAEIASAPYLRLETLAYTERTTGSLQLAGEHKLPFEDWEAIDGAFRFTAPEVDWVLSQSFASLDQPDKRQFGSLWRPGTFTPPFPPFVPDPVITDPFYEEFKPGENINFGNLQRIYKTIDEDSDQLSVNVKLPFEQWDELKGYLKLGVFSDKVDRDFFQEAYNNGTETFSQSGPLTWEDSWADVWGDEDHPISPSTFDVSYDGRQEIDALYGMMDLPLNEKFKMVGGVRLEETNIRTDLRPTTPVDQPHGDTDAAFYDLVELGPVKLIDPTTGEVNEDANARFNGNSTLPSLGLEYRPAERWTLRVGYSQTIARQTFKELSPLIQQEFLGGPIFIGNPNLGLSALENYDLRADYVPHPGGLVSLSLFQKDIRSPIEYVQRQTTFDFRTAVNYPKGRIRGMEFELRQNLEEYIEPLRGASVGFNATFLDSRVDLLPEDIALFEAPAIDAPMTSRDMTGAPEHLYNFYVTYDLKATRTRAGLFYTITGDTLVAGADATQVFIPNVYATEFDTLNFTLTQDLGQYFQIRFKAQNLTNPKIQQVYRSEYIGDDVLKTSFTKGIDYSLSIGARFTF